GAGAAGERLTGTALPHAKPQFVRTDDLCESRIHAARESRRSLDKRPFVGDRRFGDIVDELYRVRIAERDEGDPAPFVADGECVDGVVAETAHFDALRVETDRFRSEPGDAHVDAHAAVVLDR